MIVECYKCGNELDTKKDEYTSILESGGGFSNDENNMRAHIKCPKIHAKPIDNRTSK